ncbi:hypothetical protein A3C32_04375 [Candidatus Daviesbacteria bacterium RIFCSPHIGHO2_02_FULL_41_14]|uniref:UDP-N-acetylglucosamine 2-epimerase domain-containing protein n=1 Tax=Candidatus Daviesbacteria bacterium RIFCSPLOWO2_01_FULL_40_24 TaxID=1797787 RepID=A0A1F5MJD7_9BACT|nr:MAG: hypothetical protein A3C32_04375 [Candidatus Daviesbacteria bacterium RIFCSPHIGHO2_02_FULL_41_14]OGE65463.1 MAG: hypothetical protein A3B49_01070 [Candidatus Daviesbacteria bacterium RIFCSPLOWO2_01_FULL_40_24]
MGLEKQRKINIYFFIGVTGELIKHAPIIKEFQLRKIPFKIISSGQSKIHFDELIDYIGLMRADIAFPEKANKSSMFFFIFWVFKTLLIAPGRLNQELKGLKKGDTYFIVQGDTVSSLVGAIIAKLFLGVKLIHNESGLSSGNLLIPFPEEICRNIIWRLADVLTPQNSWAKGNLKRIKAAKLNTKQNTLIESYQWAINTPGTPSEIAKFGRYYYLFMHRQEHVIFRKEYSKKTLEFVIKNADPRLKCVLLNNPLTTSVVGSLSKTWDPDIQKRVIIAPRFPYKDFMKLLKNAEFLATDSATNQIESYYMGVPYLGLRDRTENMEGLNENAILAKDNKRTIKGFLRNYKRYRRPPLVIEKNPSKIIVDYLVDHEWS